MVKVFFWLIMGCLLLVNCSDPQDWDPRGEVNWVQWREDEVGGIRTAVATFSATNTGRVGVSAVDLALTLRTDREEYYLQCHTALDLAPGKTAFSAVEWVYRSLDERGGLSGQKVVSVSFR